jgi:ABC-type multidrug transport system ATPase subunit
MKHHFRINKYHDTFALVIMCVHCPDPEPETVDYVWIDSDGTVLYDGDTIEKLFLFLARHDAFKLTEVSNG